MNIKTFVVEAEHYDETVIGHLVEIESILASEFFNEYSEEDRGSVRMCRLVCEVKEMRTTPTPLYTMRTNIETTAVIRCQ